VSSGVLWGLGFVAWLVVFVPPWSGLLRALWFVRVHAPFGLSLRQRVRLVLVVLGWW